MKDKKTQTIILAVLVAVILGVGAFQFSSMGASEAPAKKPEAKKDVKPDTVEENATVAEEPDPMRKLYSMSMPARDPFQEQTASLRPVPTQTTVAPPQTKPQPQPGPRPRGSASVPPFPPLTGSLPNVTLTPSAGSGAPAIMPDQGPSYTVSGVIRGSKNAAVFTDSQGNQRLVHEGQALDGDTRVVSIRDGEVVVRRNGKTERLQVGGNP